MALKRPETQAVAMEDGKFSAVLQFDGKTDLNNLRAQLQKAGFEIKPSGRVINDQQGTIRLEKRGEPITVTLCGDQKSIKKATQISGFEGMDNIGRLQRSVSNI